jgi:hypothetical protein
MENWKAIAFLLLCGPVLASCGNSKDAATIYVLAPPQRASQFTQDLAIIAKRHGLNPNLGQATDDRGHILRVIEAQGRGVRLWAQNMPLSGQENPTLCGSYTEGHPDPGQYIVTIDHVLPVIAIKQVLPTIAEDEPRELILEISNELRASSYDVRSSPVVCSSLSKEDSRL